MQLVISLTRCKILKAGAAIDQARNTGFTPLYIACQEGHLDVARLLLETGAAVNQAHVSGATPLFIACIEGHLEIARLLLERRCCYETSR